MHSSYLQHEAPVGADGIRHTAYSHVKELIGVVNLQL